MDDSKGSPDLGCLVILMTIIMVGIITAIAPLLPSDHTIQGMLTTKVWVMDSDSAATITLETDTKTRKLVFDSSEVSSLEVGNTYKIRYHSAWGDKHITDIEEIEATP